MTRLNPFAPRTTATKKQYLGKVLIFCEGKTEYNYFQHFAEIINGNKKYAHIELQPINTEGNASHVLNYADNFFNMHSSFYSTYERYRVFDCDDPQNIQSVINQMQQSSNAYNLLLTNLLFETWLLMHFEEVDKPLSKIQTYRSLVHALRIPKYKTKEKASKGLIRKAIGNGDNVKLAIANAKQLERRYRSNNYDIGKDIVHMNPYTQVHILVEKILLEI